MSWATLAPSLLGPPDLQTPTPPPASTLNQVINELPGLLAHWPLAGDLNARVGPVNFSAESGGGGVTGQPTLATNDTGGSSRLFNTSATVDRLVAADFAALDSVTFSVIVLTVPMSNAARGNVLTRASGSLPGSWGLENDAGRGRFYIRDDSGFQILTTDPATIATGFTTGFALCWNGSSVDAYLQQVGSSIIKESLAISLSSVSMAATLSLGAFYGEASPFIGAAAHVILCSGKLSQTDVETVFDEMQNIVSANDVDAGTVTSSENTDVDVLSTAIYRTGTVTIDTDASSSMLSVVSDQVRIVAGATEGADSGVFDIDGETATLSFNVQDAASPSGDEYNGGEWFGSTGWGASAGNGTGVGRYSTSKYWAFRFTAPFTATCNRLRWNLPKRAAYKGGTGGDMRVTIRSDNGSGFPDLTGGGIVWQSSLFVMTSGVDGKMIYPAGVTAFFGFGSDEGAEIVINANLTAGATYHIVWTNENSNPSTNWYSINHAWNRSLPRPYHQFPLAEELSTLQGNSSDVFSLAASRFIPYFQIRRASDDLWFGQNYFDCGTTSNIMSIAGDGSKDGNSREIGGAWQIRQRWTHTAPTMNVSRWRGRVWRRKSNTTHPLRIRLVEEGTGELANVTVAASSIFQPAAGYDNVSGDSFAPIDVSLGSTIELTNGETYQLEVSTDNDDTIFAMRAPNGYDKGSINVGWGGWLGRGEYSTDGGASWTGMHMYSTDDRSDCDWSMLLHSTAP